MREPLLTDEEIVRKHSEPNLSTGCWLWNGNMIPLPTKNKEE